MDSSSRRVSTRHKKSIDASASQLDASPDHNATGSSKARSKTAAAARLEENAGKTRSARERAELAKVGDSI